ncbi:NACHT and WD repeat domain-containing protein [Paludisphaera soli]|uniref:NACHT and WD repeat domain-containing protein n=1 Tax=Paludisphaera soli TaxID=2712865 RepID=UPI0013EB9807|nr:AAA family ATPase [Paludisphaera soli]
METCALEEMRRPYPGLRPFRPDEADLFFGRDEQVDELLDRLGRSRFLAVVGESGCGKSSLILAGMVPALETGFLDSAGSDWLVTSMRPGSAPMRNLAAALLDSGLAALDPISPGEDFALIEAELRRGPLGFLDVLREGGRLGDARLLLVVDQFEEIFRFRNDEFSSSTTGEKAVDPDEAAAFVSLLLRTVHQPEGRVYVVLTMRSDFLGDCALFTGLPEMLNDSQFLTPRLSYDQRKAAIEGPARVEGGCVAPDLTNAILNDMGSGPDQLPLMQHAMMRAWTVASLREPGRPTLVGLQDYIEVGCLNEALSRHADWAFDRLEETQKPIAERLFRSLSGGNAGKRDTRRPTKLGEIAAIADVDPGLVAEVVEDFRGGDLNFLTPAYGPIGPETVLDIGHESLIRQWARLNVWAKEEAKSAEIYRRLEQTSRLWSEGLAGLWGYPDLDQALLWREAVRPNHAWAQRYGGDYPKAIQFLIASSNERDRKHAEEEQRKAYEADRDRRLAIAEAESRRAEAERRRAEEAELREKAEAGRAEAERDRADVVTTSSRRLRRRLWALQITTMMVLIAAAFAFYQYSEATKQRRTAEVQRRMAEVQRQMAVDNLREAQSATAFAVTEKERAHAQERIAESRRLAALSESARTRRLDLALLLALEAIRGETQEARACLQHALDERPGLSHFVHLPLGRVSTVVYGPGGSLAAGYAGGGGKSPGGMAVFDAEGRHLRSLEVTEGAVRSAAYYEPAGELAAGYGGLDVGGVVVFDAKGQRLRSLEVKEGAVQSLAYGPAGELAAGYVVGGPATGHSGGVAVFDAKGQRLRSLEVREGAVRSLAYGPTGELAAGYITRGNVGGVAVFDAKGQRLRSLEVREGAVTSLAYYEPTGELAAGYGGLDVGGVVVFDAKGQRLRSLEVAEGAVQSVAYGPAGELAAGYGALSVGGVAVFDRDGRRAPSLEVREGAVQSVAYGPAGELAAGYSGLGVGGVAVFDRAGRRARSLEVKSARVWSVAYGPAGELAAGYVVGGPATGYSGGVAVFDAKGQRLRSLKVAEGAVQSVAYGPAGELAAGYGGLGVGDAGGVAVFDRESRRARSLEVREGAVRSVAYGPTGELAAGYITRGNVGGVAVFDRDGRRSRSLEVREGAVQCVAYGPAGELAAGYGTLKGGGVAVFDVEGHRRLTLELAEGVVVSVAWGPGGGLAAGYDNGGVAMFDPQGRRTRLLDVKEGEVASVAYGPFGSLAAGYFSDADLGGVIVFDGNPTSWKREAGRMANRNLTRAEWSEAFPDFPKESPYRRTVSSLPWPDDLSKEERLAAEAWEIEHPDGNDEEG